MSTLQKIENLIRKDQDCLKMHGEPLRFKRGQALFYQGHNPYGIYWISKGEVSLIHTDEGGERMERREKGAILGLEELTRGETYLYTAEASSNCEVIFIDKNMFQEWLDQHAKECQQREKNK